MVRLRKDNRGQATTEYILLLATVVTFYIIIARVLGQMGVSRIVTAPVNDSFARAYRYGHPKAKGFDDGGPENHPRATGGGTNNFRIFINPEVR